jgi:hypothetical protein
MNTKDPKNRGALDSKATLMDGWKEYLDGALPNNLSAEQKEKAHRAFMTGALYVLCQFDRIGADAVDDAAAGAYLGDLYREAEQWADMRIEQIKDQMKEEGKDEPNEPLP